MVMFIQQFQNVAEINGCTEKETLLHLRSSLEDKAREYGYGGSAQEIYSSLVSTCRYGMPTRQAKEHLLGLRKDTYESMFDLRLRIQQLVKVAHPSMPRGEREQLAIDHLIGSLNKFPL